MPTIGIFKMPYIREASVNHMYGRDENKNTFLKPKAKAWKKQLASAVSNWLNENGITIPDKPIVCVELTTHFPPRGGSRGRRPDPSNFIKLPNDAISKALGIDDCVFIGSYNLGVQDDDGGGCLSYLVEIHDADTP